jgi:hypothetical protein
MRDDVIIAPAQLSAYQRWKTDAESVCWCVFVCVCVCVCVYIYIHIYIHIYLGSRATALVLTSGGCRGRRAHSPRRAARRHSAPTIFLVCPWFTV